MCLIAFAWRAHPDYRLILAANRDELHARPAAPLQWWADAPKVLAGRDLQAGGSWLGISRSGRFATVTNYREHLQPRPNVRSRGGLVSAFVTADAAPERFASGIDGAHYAGFSLLLADLAPGGSLVYASNRGDPARLLAPGVYGLSNASLETPWHKVRQSKARLAALLEKRTVTAEGLFQLLSDREPGSDDDLAEDAGDLPPSMARAATAPFIVTPAYGTRCSTVVLIGSSGQALVCERRFDSAGEPVGESRVEFDIA